MPADIQSNLISFIFYFIKSDLNFLNKNHLIAIDQKLLIRSPLIL